MRENLLLFWHENNSLSTQEKEAKAQAWVPGKNEYQERKKGHCAEAWEETGALNRLVSTAMSFPLQNRLSGKKLFDTVFKKGKTVRGRFFIAKLLRNSLPYSRLAVVIPKTVTSQAVMRNRLRRRVQSLVAINMLSTVSFDAVLIALPLIVSKAFGEIKSDVQQDIKKLFVHS